MKRLRFVYDNLEEIISGSTFAFMTAITILNVFLRYVTNNSPSWIEELCRFSFIWMTFFGAAVCTKHGKHIVIDVVTSVAKGHFKTFLDVVATVVNICFMIFAIYYGLKLASVTSIKSATLNIPMTYLLYVIPVSFSLILFRTLEGTVKRLKGTSISGEQV